MSEDNPEDSDKDKTARLRKVKKLPPSMKMSVNEMLEIAEKKKKRT